MKSSLLMLFLLFCTNWANGQVNQLDFTINPLGLFVLYEEEALHLDLSIEGKIAEDFGVMLSLTSSPLPLNNNIDAPFVTPYSANHSMIIIQGNYYMRPKRELDRWYLTSMIGRESARGDFSRFSSTTFTRIEANGKLTRYHAGMGLGYKRIFRRIVLNLGAIVTQEFANRYSQSLLNVFPDLKKETINSRGARITFGLGYRFNWNKNLLKRENQI